MALWPDILEAVSAVIDDMKLPRAKVCSITLNEAPSMNGKWNVMMASTVCREVHDSDRNDRDKMHCSICSVRHSIAVQLSYVLKSIKYVNGSYWNPMRWFSPLSNSQALEKARFSLTRTHTARTMSLFSFIWRNQMFGDTAHLLQCCRLKADAFITVWPMTSYMLSHHWSYIIFINT